MKLSRISKGKLKNGRPNWYIDCEIDGKRRRIKGDINKYKTPQERLAAANRLKEKIDEQMILEYSEGKGSSKESLSYKTALDWALAEKKKIWRPGSVKEYVVPLNFFYKRMDELGLSGMKINKIDRLMIRTVLEPVKSHYSYLKYKSNLGNLFKFLMDWEKIPYNPCDFKAMFKKPEAKKRLLPTKEQLKIISQHLEANYPDFLTYLIVINMSAIRPKEILELRVGDIDMHSGMITIRSEVSKNNKTQTIVVPKLLETRLKILKLHLFPKHYFAFGYDFIPQERVSAVSRDRATKFYKTHVKDALKIQCDMYALKHLGLRSMRNQGIEPEAVQMQARHSKYDETLGYTGLDRPELRDQLREFEGDL